jgi:hypothetical protein
LSSPFHSAQLYDLSQDGMRMLTDIVQSGSLHIFHPDLTASEQCHLEIEIPDEGQTLTLIGRAVWYDHDAGERAYTFRVGIEFVDIESEDRKRIQSLITREQGTPSPSSSKASLPDSSE